MTTIEGAFVSRARYYLNTEYRAKLRQALTALPEESLWWRPNPQSNSVGNLLLHLSGNVRQWIVAGIGGAPDARDRPGEFTAQSGGSASDLLAGLEATLDEADLVLAGLDGRHLLEFRDIQGRRLAVFEAVFHVVEHFSFHLGQIVYIAKLRAPGSIQFYDDAGGLARPKW
jgi:uncharacterized damage-inducible protein DinB